MRVCLFTDTLGDVNGVSRFVRTLAAEALKRNLELHVLTSTRFECPDAPNIWNVKPLFARPMPAYPTLDVVWPNRSALVRTAAHLRPDVVHVSTPGPVGMVGRKWAKRNGVPLVGTYHTDFPAYVEHLLDDPALTWATRRVMRWFYAPFARVLTRSAEYAEAVVSVGVARERVRRLEPGIDVRAFARAGLDASGGVWSGVKGVRGQSVKVLYAGRVSVEKNLPLLVKVWPGVRAELARRGVDAQLIVVGDGPYRAEMEAALAGQDAVFAGFRHGRELAEMYASSDVFVFPSTTDTLGQAVLEAQCAGLPAIVSDRGGPSGVVDHGVTGLVIRAADAGAWVSSIVELAIDARRRRAMGDAAAAKVSQMTFARSFDSFWRAHEEVRR